MIELATYKKNPIEEPYSLTLSEKNYRDFVEDGFITIKKEITIRELQTITERMKNNIYAYCHVFFNKLASWERDIVKLNAIMHDPIYEPTAKALKEQKVQVSFYFQYLDKADSSMSALDIALKNDIKRALKYTK